jgi:hypothetical protein
MRRETSWVAAEGIGVLGYWGYWVQAKGEGDAGGAGWT